MKKYLIWMLIISFIISIIFIGSACKAEPEVIIKTVPGETVIVEVEKELPKVVWSLESFLPNLPQRIARELGYFEEEGVDIEFRYGAMGIDTMDHVIAKDADLGAGAHWALVMRMTKPNIGMGGITADWSNPVGFMATGDIENISDLKGKTIAIIQGSVWDWFNMKTLEIGGLTIDDVSIINFGSPVDYLSAALKGDVDAAWFWEANLVAAQENLEPKGWHVLGTAEELVPGGTNGMMIIPMSIEAAAEKPEALAGSIRAFQRAVNWMGENPEGAVDYANKLMGISKEDAAYLLPFLNYHVGFPKSIVDTMRGMKEFAVENGYITSENDYNFDDKLLYEPMKIAYPETVE